MENQINNNQNINTDMEQKVMSEITTGKVKLRSKYVFWAEKFSLGSVFALDLLLAILFFNLVLFYFKASDNLIYLSFGSRGLYAFWESFPYGLVIILIILILIAGLLIKQSDVSYKKPFGYVSVGLIVFIMVLGIILTFTDIAERFENESYTLRPTGLILRRLLQDGFGDRGHSVAGRVLEVADGYILVQTPRSQVKLDLSNLEMPLEIMPGYFIIAIGQRQDKVFVVRNLRVTGEREIPMIQRGVILHFGPLNP
jgi:hypothetical protein